MRISPRYFWVELITAVLFLVIYLHFGPTLQTVAYCLFTAALIPAFFIDAEMFIIPDELNTFMLFVAFAFDGWGIAHGYPGHALVGGWLPQSVLGAMICAGIFVGIQILGSLLFRKDAMGDGDVKLARAIGAMLPLKLALVSFFLAIVIGVLYSVFKLSADKMRSDSPGVAEQTDEGLLEDEALPEATSLGEIALFGVIYLLFADLVIQFAAFLGVPAAKKLAGQVGEEDVALEDDTFVAGPTHIPFGPHMVLGALLSIFVGDTLVNWYLKWAHLA
jgi:leader peptidase (prepilin peptidase) / N-methyltransferase